MKLLAMLETIGSREDLAALVDQMRKDFEKDPSGWENADIASFLEAMAAWLRDMDGYYLNRGECVPNTPTWRTIGEILLAARSYE